MIEIMQECPCGCGEKFSPVGSRGRKRSYFSPGCSLRVNCYMKQPGAINPFKGLRHTEETRKILSEKASIPKPYLRGSGNGMSGRTGVTNPNWKGGSSAERQRLYASADWKELVRIVRARDGCNCRKCGKAKWGINLHLHHIKPWATYPDLRFDPDNIITLCRDCHIEAHRKGVRHQ